MSAYKSHEEFIFELSLIYPDITVLEIYTKNDIKLLIKDSLYIKYLASPRDMLRKDRGRKPSVHTALDKNDWFIKHANFKCRDKFDYSKVNYINGKTPVTIICPIHDEFKQKTITHLRTKVIHGCPKCGKNLPKLWTDNQIYTDAYFYILPF